MRLSPNMIELLTDIAIHPQYYVGTWGKWGKTAHALRQRGLATVEYVEGKQSEVKITAAGRDEAIRLGIIKTNAEVAALPDDQWFEYVWTKRPVFVEKPEQPRRFSTGDRVRIDWETGDSLESPRVAAWYRAVVIGPSTQRDGDFFVRVTEASPNSGVTVGARLSPTLFRNIDLVLESVDV